MSLRIAASKTSSPLVSTSKSIMTSATLESTIPEGEAVSPGPQSDIIEDLKAVAVTPSSTASQTECESAPSKTGSTTEASKDDEEEEELADDDSMETFPQNPDLNKENSSMIGSKAARKTLQTFVADTTSPLRKFGGVARPPASPHSIRSSRSKISHAERSKNSDSHTLTRQQSILHESGKMLEYARKEVYKLRAKNAQLSNDFDLLKTNNQRLIDANASLGETCDALNKHAKNLSKANHRLKSDAKKKQEKLKAELNESTSQNKAMKVQVTELKEELKMKHGSYVGEVQSRLQYQKTMAKIVDAVQARCRDHRLVEDILSMIDECEGQDF